MCLHIYILLKYIANWYTYALLLEVKLEANPTLLDVFQANTDFSNLEAKKFKGNTVFVECFQYF